MPPPTLPLIPFSPFLTPTSPTSKQTTATALLTAFRTSGFLYLTSHPIPPALIAKTFALSQKFFSRPENEKAALAWTTPEANRGWSGPGREKVSDGTSTAEVGEERARGGEDLKESFEIGREGVAEYPNHWPDGPEGEEFKQHMLLFYEKCRELHGQILRAVAVGLGLEEGWFEGSIGKGENTLRLLWYPEVQGEVLGGRVRAGTHSDYGSLTLLFQDTRGGLQVLSPEGEFVDATPIEGSIVVNAGDILARWSNDVIKSTKHRVVEPPVKAEVYPARYSIAYFCNPDSEAVIDAIPGTYGEEGKRYEAIKSGEYLVQRLAATY